MAPQISAKHTWIPSAHTDGFRILIQNQDGNIIGGTQLLEVHVKIIRADAAALRRLIELAVSLHHDFLLVCKIKPLQKSAVNEPAQQHRSGHQSNKNACKLLSDGISHACSAPFSSGSNLYPIPQIVRIISPLSPSLLRSFFTCVSIVLASPK